LCLLFVTAVPGCGKNELLPNDPASEIAETPGFISEAAPPENESAGEPAYGPEPEIVYAPENLLNGIPVVGKREVKNGLYQSFLTGEWKDVNVAFRRPIAVQIINTEMGLPQYGISAASIIFEAPVEGRITRLLAIFEDYDDLERIGPVRGTRDYFVYEAMGKEAYMCNWGLAVVYTADLLNSDKVQNISVQLHGIDEGADEAYLRIDRPDYYTEYTGYLSIEGLNEAIKRLEYETIYSDQFVPQFVFAAENTRVDYHDYPTALFVYPGGKELNPGGYGHKGNNENPYFEYNPDERLYYRYQYGGEMIDELNDAQLAVTNIVFQYAHGEIRDQNDYLAFQVHGEGEAKVFTNGKVIDGTWSRYAGDGTPAKFYDSEGHEIVLNQGKTWICLIWDAFSEWVMYTGK
jgi:hypothetical protein